MEKTLTIDGRQVRFKVTAGTMPRYKAQFGRELLADIEKLQKIDENNLETLDFDAIYRVIWVAAKTADPSIPDMLTWLDEFDEMDVFGIWAELAPIITKNLKVDRKNA